MEKIEKIIQKFFDSSNTSYQEAERILSKIGFELFVSGSHHIFRKKGYPRNIALKKRKILLPYQTKLVRKVLEEHGY